MATAGRQVRIENTTPALDMEGVVREHGVGQVQVTAVREASLRISRGEVVVVYGPSGAGKSSLLQIAGCLSEPTRGAVRVDGNDVVGIGAKRRADLRLRSIGYVFQEYNLLSVLTALENTALPLEIEGTRRARQRALTALEELGIAELADRYPGQMSGGQRQRVAIARALIGSRRLVVADEPTGALDSVSSRAVRDALVGRAREHGAGVLIGTHDQQWSTLADRVLVMRDGVLGQDRKDPL
ncbi:ABC transporter ATP-binding protein [Nocardiopsis sp. CNT312]|uniref:ABC transporter ATP-binding protein n=1 Tax=Nocardiopsis sp. CNT312 TaxID=1137268 RepID=UPI000686D9A8|nr:ABC transporter ATP-binding protein [Nocardiopsis sp. CNT312]